MLGDIIQPTHLLFILVVALLVLGPKRLPEVGRSLGRGIRDFRDAISSHTAEARELRDMVYGEESLGGTTTAGEHPVATTTATAGSAESRSSAATATVATQAFTARQSVGPIVQERPGPDSEPVYGD